MNLLFYESGNLGRERGYRMVTEYQIVRMGAPN